MHQKCVAETEWQLIGVVKFLEMSFSLELDHHLYYFAQVHRPYVRFGARKCRTVLFFP